MMLFAMAYILMTSTARAYQQGEEPLMNRKSEFNKDLKL